MCIKENKQNVILPEGESFRKFENRTSLSCAMISKIQKTTCIKQKKGNSENKANTESCLDLPKLIGPCFNHVRIIY